MEDTKEKQNRLKAWIKGYMEDSEPPHKEEFKGIVAEMKPGDIESVYKEIQLQYIYKDKKDLWYDICVYNPKWVGHMLSGMRSGGSTTCVGYEKERASYKQLLNIMIAAKAKKANPLRKALEIIKKIQSINTSSW